MAHDDNNNVNKNGKSNSRNHCILFLKNVVLLFSIVCFAKVIAHYGSSGKYQFVTNIRQKYTQFILYQRLKRTNNLHFRQNYLRKRTFAQFVYKRNNPFSLIC